VRPTLSKEAGKRCNASGLQDAIAERPASPHNLAVTRWLAVIVTVWIVAFRQQPELVCITCEALRQGGIL